MKLDRDILKGYIARLEEQDDKINQLEEELSNSKNFHCPHFKTTGNGYVACNLGA